MTIRWGGGGAVGNPTIKHAGDLLNEAWYLLVAAGRMADAAEVRKIYARLTPGPGRVPPAPPGSRRGSIAEQPARAVTRSPADLCIPEDADNLYCALPAGHSGEHDLDWRAR